MFVNGTLVGTQSITLVNTANTTLSHIQYFMENFTVSDSAWSEFIITQGEPTIGWRLATIYAESTLENTFDAGDHTSISETHFDPATYLESQGEAKALFNCISLPALPPESHVRALTIKSTGTAGVGAPAHLSNIMKIGGTEYVLPSLDTESLEFKVDTNQLIENNPATGQKWTTEEIDATLFGVKVSNVAQGGS
jgi:hypothetical protein